MERFQLQTGGELAFTRAGDASKPAILLLHGTPNSSRMFRDVIPALGREASAWPR
jgi:pimeloyl-ACP methyl ester carboxylesterase